MPHHTFHYPWNVCQGPGQGGKPREEGRIHGRLTTWGHTGVTASSPGGLGRSFLLALAGSLSPAGVQPSAGCEEQRCHRQWQSPEQGWGAMPSFTPEKRLANTSLSPRCHRAPTAAPTAALSPGTAPPHPTALPGAPGTCRDHRGREQFGAEGILELIQCQPPVLLQDPELSVQERPPRAHHSDPAPLGAL